MWENQSSRNLNKQFMKLSLALVHQNDSKRANNQLIGSLHRAQKARRVGNYVTSICCDCSEVWTSQELRRGYIAYLR